jgi:hypothetical protein
MKRKTTKARHQSRQSVLEVRVMSPRIAWLSFTKFLGSIIKLAFLLAVLGGIGWGVWSGIEYAFLKNPDFRLQVIDLNENPIIDQVGLIELFGINLANSPSLFDVNTSEATRKIKSLPAIVDAHVERHLPGTLVVRVECRTPKAWVALKGANLDRVRSTDGMLLDAQGAAYPCPPRQAEFAMRLPIILLTPHPGFAIEAGKAVNHPELAHCFSLLNSAQEADPEAPYWIQSISQDNEWSMLMITHDHTSATFGLSDHLRQINNLRTALDHAGSKGYLIDTINLIPKYNVPITVRESNAPPHAIPVPSTTSTGGASNRSDRNISSVTTRN